MKEILYKSFEIIVENQRNADGKSNLFIVLITAFLTFMGEIPLGFISEEERSVILWFFMIMVIPLLIFIISLIPLYSDKYRFINRNKHNETLNLFYWKTITYFKNSDDFEKEIQNRYAILELDTIEEDLIQQIYANAMILEYKKQLHKLAFSIIYQFVIIMIVAVISYFVFKQNPYLTIVLLVIVELVVLNKIYGLYSKVKSVIFTKKKNDKVGTDNKK